jgi:tRNA pseudouridine38-40 synthase
MRYRIHISYDGTDFLGWQRQSKSPQTIQEILESVISKIFNEPISIMGSGRTDSGVHAIEQVAHFNSTKKNPCKDLCRALNGMLPRTIVVLSAYEAPEEFHAQKSVLRKTYKYMVLNRARPSALLSRQTTWIRKPLNLENLNQMASLIVGAHDFKSFQNSGTPVRHTRRKIYKAQWRIVGPGLLEFRVTGQGFLKQMVRNLVGTMIGLDLSGRNHLKFQEIMDSLDRKKGLRTALPNGLHLCRVYYPKDLDIKCLKI